MGAVGAPMECPGLGGELVADDHTRRGGHLGLGTEIGFKVGHGRCNGGGRLAAEGVRKGAARQKKDWGKEEGEVKRERA